MGLREWFDPVARRAKSRHPFKFVRTVLESTVSFVSLPPGCEGIDAAELTPELLIEQAEAAAKHLSQNEEGFAPLAFDRDDQSCVPVFSSARLAEPFLGEYSKKHNRVFPFQLLGLPGKHLLPSLFASGQAVVVNPSTAYEREFTQEEVDFVLELLEPQCGWPA